MSAVLKRMASADQIHRELVNLATSAKENGFDQLAELIGAAKLEADPQLLRAKNLASAGAARD